MDLSTMTVREIALAAPQTTRIFEEYKIDFCCGGRTSLGDACVKAGVSSDVVSEKLKSVLEAPASTGDAERLPSATLVDHIIDKHHEFTRSEMLRISGLLEKVCWKHGEKHPELYQLRDSFQALTSDLIMHMRKEEMVLFPYIHDLVRATERGIAPLMPPFGTISHPVKVMEWEHDEAGTILKKMREVTDDYKVPDGACPSFTALYFGLDALEKDLHQHIHLENNVLFPKALKLDKEVRS
jgi:regulator of cell morphogenesis and NO signaling